MQLQLKIKYNYPNLLIVIKYRNKLSRNKRKLINATVVEAYRILTYLS